MLLTKGMSALGFLSFDPEKFEILTCQHHQKENGMNQKLSYLSSRLSELPQHLRMLLTKGMSAPVTITLIAQVQPIKMTTIFQTRKKNELRRESGKIENCGRIMEDLFRQQIVEPTELQSAGHNFTKVLVNQKSINGVESANLPALTSRGKGQGHPDSTTVLRYQLTLLILMIVFHKWMRMDGKYSAHRHNHSRQPSLDNYQFPQMGRDESLELEVISTKIWDAHKRIHRPSNSILPEHTGMPPHLPPTEPTRTCIRAGTYLLSHMATAAETSPAPQAVEARALLICRHSSAPPIEST